MPFIKYVASTGTHVSTILDTHHAAYTYLHQTICHRIDNPVGHFFSLDAGMCLRHVTDLDLCKQMISATRPLDYAQSAIASVF